MNYISRIDEILEILSDAIAEHAILGHMSFGTYGIYANVTELCPEQDTFILA